ncbi:MAG: pectate lyase [Acidimicrobiales bacterium]|nr:MAG: pectate lyase [Acidimicrobiales bacterium]
MRKRTLAVVIAVVIALASTTGVASSARPTLAFPGAQGFGAFTEGGRGGDVAIVTTLADGGPGSLRDALATAEGPRTIVFEVAGEIALESPLRITGSHLTLAGQTSPGGITISGYPTEVVNSQHVVIRHLRFRPGDRHAAGVPGKPGRGNADLVGDAADALAIIGSSHVIVDHVSASWSMDETLSVTKSSNVTVQHSIISESLNDSFHTEGTHGFGSLVRGTGTDGYSFIGNLWAHHQRRMPAVGGQQDPPPPGEESQGIDIDLVGNVMYDWMLFPNHVLHEPYDVRANVVDNAYLAGPSLAFCACAWINFETDADQLLIHHSGNRVDVDEEGLREMVDADIIGPVTIAADPIAFSRPQIALNADEDPAIAVLLGAGASVDRDLIDLRVVLETIFRRGGVIDSQEDVGGWIEPDVRNPEIDLDRDGMADRWEERRGLDPTNPHDHAGHDLSARYTNLERYLHRLTRS